MRAPKSAPPGRLLTQVAGERRTGALIVGGTPGGTVHLCEGFVTYAESAAAPGVGELLTASGRLAPRTWQAALDAGTPRATVGRLLLDQGHITQGELELCVLGATYDAAYFALSPAAAPVDFLDGATHWLGDLVRVDPAALVRESRRRGRLLDDIFPHPQLDTEAVIPVTRPPRERITLTAPQWELLVHADGQRTPADLAQLLGRAGYATIQELRRLAAAGLIELPTPRDTPPSTFVRLPRARGTAVDVHRPEPPPAAAVAATARTGPPPSPPQQREPADPATASGTAYRPPKLARRKPGAKLPKEIADDPTAIHPGTDEVLLKRIRTALRALR
ncbi:MarR family transcriptional regulator [Actinoplanes sp. NPDC051859]|uniref:MarR family transcriptional regulator n=1 Tax=Actinoplanes sp. NPDC051859 TaxID=3363909 RepID=UPI0037B18FDD